MLAWLANLLAGPIVNKLLGGAVEAYKAKLAVGSNKDTLAADLAARELAVQQAEITAQAQIRIAQIGHWYAPENLFGYVMVFYVGKVIVWDAALGLGTTDPVRGDVAVWAGWIMAFYFGKRGIENVARIMKAK